MGLKYSRGVGVLEGGFESALRGVERDGCGMDVGVGLGKKKEAGRWMETGQYYRVNGEFGT